MDILDGRYPPFSYLNSHDTEAMAKDLLANATHMAYTKKWLEAVARELAPYGASHTVAIKANPSEDQKAREVSGPLLFVQLEDDMAIERTNYAGPLFWRYMQDLRAMLEAGGLDVQSYINPTDMRVSAAGFGLERPIGAMGQWYMPPGESTEPGERHLNLQDAATIEFFVEELKTQPAFPPILIEFQAGWYCFGDDDRPQASPPENTLLSSRLALANGLHGINYFPLQDTVTPAGYSVPWANRFYRWDAALDPNGSRQPRAVPVGRNAQMLQRWGEWIAASHKRADYGIVYPVGAYPEETLRGEDVEHVSHIVERLEEAGRIVNLSSELLDAEYQPVEQFLRHGLVLLPVPDPSQAKFLLSEKAQQTLVEYVRRGGMLLFLPARPSGAILQQLWAGSPDAVPSPGTTLARFWRFGAGRVIEPDEKFGQAFATRKESAEENTRQLEDWAQQLLEIVRATGVATVVRRAPEDNKSHGLIVTQLVSNEGTETLGNRKNGTALLSVTNLDQDAASEQKFEILSPNSAARSNQEKYISVDVTVPPRLSVLFPVEQPLCSGIKGAPPCEDSIVFAGAELLRAERDNRTMELTFFAPARAEIRLRLESQPAHVMLDDEIATEGHWDANSHTLTVDLPRGAAPQYTRLLKITLRYTPSVPEKPKKDNHAHPGFDFSITDAVRLPLGAEVSLATQPALVAIPAEAGVELRLEATNADEERYHDVSFKLQGPLRGNANFRMLPKGITPGRIKLKTASGNAAGSAGDLSPDGLIHGTLEVSSGDDQRNVPILFVPVKEGAVNHYQFDFDRDGANEWVLENTHLRLIVSPESGGQAMALVDKISRLDLLTSVGGLSDHFSFADNPRDTSPERARGRYGMFNRAYQAEWTDEKENPALRMRYEAPDVLPGGASIEKTARIEDNDVLRVNYRVQLNAAQRDPAGQEKHSQSFLAVNSVPVVFRAEHSTQFCWGMAEAKPGPEAKDAPAKHCESYKPGSAPLELPAGTNRLEVRTPGKAGLALEWDCARNCARMTIQMKNFSALLSLQFPPLTPGGPPGEYTVRFSPLTLESPGSE